MRPRDRLPVLWTGDRILVLLFLLLTIGYGAGALRLRDGLMSDVVGPRSFPLLLTGFALTLCAIFLYRALRDAGAGDMPRWRPAARLRDLIPLALLFAYVLALQPFGYILSTLLFVVATMRTVGHPTWWGTIAFAGGLTTVTYLLFEHAFDVELPPGSLIAFLP